MNLQGPPLSPLTRCSRACIGFRKSRHLTLHAVKTIPSAHQQRGGWELNPWFSRADMAQERARPGSKTSDWKDSQKCQVLPCRANGMWGSQWQFRWKQFSIYTYNFCCHLFLSFLGNANNKSEPTGDSPSHPLLHFSSRFIRLLKCPCARFSLHSKTYKVFTGFESVIQMIKIILDLIYSHITINVRYMGSNPETLQGQELVVSGTGVYNLLQLIFKSGTHLKEKELN